MAQILDKQGLQHYANKMCNADNRKVGSKSLPTALNDIDTAIDGFKTLFETEYGTPVNMELENNENVFSIGTGINIDKKDDVENSFTDVELNGNSLVNLSETKQRLNQTSTHYSDVYLCESSRLKANTSYRLEYDFECNIDFTFSKCYLGYSTSKGSMIAESSIKFDAKKGKNILNFTLTQSELDIVINNNFKYFMVRVFIDSDKKEKTYSTKNVMLLEGDWTNKPIPQYFEGLKSIGEKEDGNHKISISSIGNNLIDFKNPIKNVLAYSMGFPFEMTKTLSSLGSKYKLLDNGFYFESPNNSHNQGVGFYVKCKKNTNYILSCMVDFKNAPAIKCQGVYSNEIPINNYINRALLISKEKISTSDFSVTFNSQNYDYLLFYFGGSWLSQMPGSVDMKFTNIQLEEISKTPYQPYKEDKKEILLNEPLRGLPNGIKDTIEKIKGEWKIVRRCVQIDLNGTEGWYHENPSQENGVNTALFASSKILNAKNFPQLCDRFIPKNGNLMLNSHPDSEGVGCWSAKDNVNIRINKSRLSTVDSAGFKAWLSQNPTKVLFELKTPIIEDISPVTLQCWKNGTISIDEVLPIEATHTVALNKSAQIQKNIEELSILRNRIEALEKQYNNSTLNQAYELELLRLDMQLDNII